MKFLYSLKETVFWYLYILFISINDFLRPKEIGRIAWQDTAGREDKKYVWFFCSTIGELNACKPFLDFIYKSSPIVIISDRGVYKKAFQDIYPQALIIDKICTVSQIKKLIKVAPPEKFYLCEIPCYINDAPCSMPYYFLRIVQKSGASNYIINGWLYDYKPTCLQDKIEEWFFGDVYYNLFEKISVQTPDMKLKIVSKGCAEEKVQVTGNMKFDYKPEYGKIIEPVTLGIFNQLSLDKRKVFILGNVGFNETEMFFSIVEDIIKKVPDCFFIIAPRHPKQKEYSALLLDLLNKSMLSYSIKSEMLPVNILLNRILILDTWGELKFYYSIADLAYVGRDHNLLEPLFYGRKVVVLNGWNDIYPSYPIYKLVQERELIHVADSVSELNTLISNTLSNEMESQICVKEELNKLSGAFEKNVNFFYGSRL